MVLGVPPQVKYTAPSSQLDKAIQTFAEHPDGIRIKKLLIFACTQAWESDLSKINAASLPELVQSLLTIAPKLEHLQAHLAAVAKALNKPTEYTALASQIIAQLSLLYPHAAASETVLLTQHLHQSVAQLLIADPQQFRIKKLLVLVSQKKWITDRQTLEAIELESLVEAVHQLAPTMKVLQQVLTSRVSKLSKAAEYSLIAERILRAFHTCYESETTDLNAEPEATKLLTEQITPSIAQLQTASTHQLLDHQLRSASVLPLEKSAVGKSAVSNPLVKKPPTLPELFDLRLEIMRYTNPFRAKILLFSLLHEPFQHTSEHNLLIKGHELDDLLRLSIQTHRSVNHLEAALGKTARMLDESHEYEPVVQIIIKSVKSIYTIAVPQSVCNQDISGNATDLIQTIATTGEVTQPDTLKR